MSERPVHELIKELSQILVQLSEKVLQNFFLSMNAVKHHDMESARLVKTVDNEIDMAEVDLEERCLAFLALQQPVARDLRTIVTIMIVTHNMQQASRVSDSTMFFYEGVLVEHAPTAQLFTNPKDPITEDYITGRFS